MHATSIADNAVGKPTPFRNPFRMFIHREPWLALIFTVTSFLIGLIWFVLHITMFSVGISLIFALIGIPLLVGWLYVWVWGAGLERSRIQSLLGVTIREPYRPLPEGSWLTRFIAKLQDRHIWLDLLYQVLLFPIGVIEFVIAFTLVFTAVVGSTAPLWYPAGGEIEMFGVRWDTWPETFLLAIMGLSCLLATPYVMVGIGRGHAWLARHMLGTDREAELTARVTQLTESRGRALESAVVDLRRIERDLHDGAQQRLVKLSMDLGLAREMLDTDPEKARELIAEAHEEAKRAMNEIRDLARGIHPAVLTDRGLGAAVTALAARSPVPVELDVELAERLPESVESNAYFIIAEGLTNIARHSQATRARVAVRRENGNLLIDIEDDGVGGAVAGSGTGLTGMADRVAALEGKLVIDSPVEGGTRIHVELPCES